MATANINSRATVEAVYPRDAFSRDVGVNSDPKAVAHHGVRIESEPDDAGAFSLVRASRHVGEEDQSLHSVFLAPAPTYDATMAPGAAYGGAAPRHDGITAESAAADGAYERFIGAVLEAARGARFQALDPQDERLKGFHGG